VGILEYLISHKVTLLNSKNREVLLKVIIFHLIHICLAIPWRSRGTWSEKIIENQWQSYVHYFN